MDGSRPRHRGAKVVVVINHEQEELSVMNISTIGLDLAKNVFQVHGIDNTGKVIVRRTLRRRQMIPFFAKLEPCLIGIEACGTSHFWSRELEALGHEVKLMPRSTSNHTSSAARPTPPMRRRSARQ